MIIYIYLAALLSMLAAILGFIGILVEVNLLFGVTTNPQDVEMYLFWAISFSTFGVFTHLMFYAD
jgi:hypothetical protein